MFPHTKPPAGTQINPLHPLSRGLVGCWLFNEGAGSLANDLSGNKNHGRLTNMAPNVQGSGWSGSEFGGGLEFDGVDDFVDCGSGGSLDITNAITISAWIKADIFNVNPGNPIFNKWYDGSTRAYYLNAMDGGEIQVGIANAAGDAQVAGTTIGLNMNTRQWYQVAMVWSTNLGEVQIYKDGEYIESIGSNATSVMNINNMNPLIGKDYSTRRFNGLIDSVCVYNIAKTPTEVKQLYEDPFCMVMKRPINRYYTAVAAGLSMAVAMHHYNQMKEN